MSFGHLGTVIWHRRTIIYLWGAVKDKCYADKPEISGTLKNNIREAIGEIQLHSINNIFKNCSDRVGHCVTSRGSHLNEIISVINRKDCSFK